MKTTSTRTVTYTFDRTFTLGDMRQMVEETKDVPASAEIHVLSGMQKDRVVTVTITDRS